MAEVLVVEDDREVRELVRDELTRRGLRVHTAGTDGAAYTLLNARPTGFDLLIADINLGSGTTGFDVARHARRLNRAIKVLYISGMSAQLDRFGVEGGEMFPKPFSPVELADRAMALVGGVSASES